VKIPSPRALACGRICEGVRTACGRLNAQGLSVRGSSPEEPGAATREQLAKYARLMTQAGR